MLGQKADAQEIMARWAYAEILSERWGAAFRHHAPAAVLELAMNNKHFDFVGRLLYAPLIKAFEHAREKGFIESVNLSLGYECIELTKAQLRKIWVLRTFHPLKQSYISYADFINGAPSRAADSTEDRYDPRFLVRSVADNYEFRQIEPGIVVNAGGHPVLLEGYFRSVLFMRFGKTMQQYLVWWPTELPRPA